MLASIPHETDLRNSLVTEAGLNACSERSAPALGTYEGQIGKKAWMNEVIPSNPTALKQPELAWYAMG